VRGVAVTLDEAGPVPAALIADTRNVYAVPFVSPVAAYDVDVDPVSATTVDQFSPLFVEDST